MNNPRLKGLLSTMVMALMTLTAFAGNVTFTVKVGNPDAVTCKVNWQPYELVAGDNYFDVEENTYVSFSNVAPYYITGVSTSTGSASGYYSGRWDFYPSSYDEGKVFTIVTINLDDIRGSEFTLKVDDPSLVSAQLSGYNTVLNDLSAGSNKIKFDDVTEQYLYLSGASYSQPLYEVRLDGEKVEPSNGSYTVPLSDGCTVDVTAQIPDIDINVTFNYTDNAFGAIKSVSVDGTEIPDFNGTSLTMKAGQILGLTNNPDYKINSVSINGTPTNWTGGYSYTQILMADAVVDVDARPYETFSATVTVDDPANIVLYRGYSYQNDVIELVPGDNSLEFSELNNIISWKAADGCYITSVTVGDEVLSEYTSSYTLSEGMNVTFVTGKTEMDKTAVIWLGGRSNANYYFSFQGYDRTAIDLADGYNVVPFYAGMTPFQLSWAGQDVEINEVYLNGELTDPMFSGSTTWQLAIEDGDVLKVFIGEEPVTCDVTFTADDDVNAGIVRDIITDVTDWRSGFSCFKGTEVAVSGPEIEVSVNGTGLEANEDGEFVFTVSETATNVKIAEKQSGIRNVAVDDNAADTPVFNLQGIRVATRATAGDLPAGIYISGGKKIVVK